MPKQKIKNKDILDKFYTNPEVAKDCIFILKNILSNKKIEFIEPSAGSGSFSKGIPCRSFDILPEDSSIEKLDFLQDYIHMTSDVVIFGNPPFGNANSLSKAFIERSMKYSQVKVIAFILPKAFNKLSMQKVFSERWILVSSTDLPDDSFLLNGNPYHVPCVFQVWVRLHYLNLPNLREVSFGNKCSDFEFCSRKDASFFLFGASPSNIIDVDQVQENNRGYFVRSFIDKDVLCDRIRSVDWKANASSSVSGGVAWFTKDEIIKHYLRKYNDPKRKQSVPYSVQTILEC